MMGPVQCGRPHSPPPAASSCCNCSGSQELQMVAAAALLAMDMLAASCTATSSSCCAASEVVVSCCWHTRSAARSAYWCTLSCTSMSAAAAPAAQQLRMIRRMLMRRAGAVAGACSCVPPADNAARLPCETRASGICDVSAGGLDRCATLPRTFLGSAAASGWPRLPTCLLPAGAPGRQPSCCWQAARPDPHKHHDGLSSFGMHL